MAHMYDRSLLSSLGFNDVDKQDPLHDLACQYVIQPSVVNSMNMRNHEKALVFDASARAYLEYPISKGAGQYKSTIGFIDAVIPVAVKYTEAGSDRVHFVNKELLHVEVKIQPVGLGEILRQINLYREYVGEYSTWILVAAFDMSPALINGLKANNIDSVRLGSGFNKFVEEQRVTVASVAAPTI